MFYGFDLGANCGFAVLDSEGSRVVSGTWKLGKRRPESIERFYQKLTALLLEYPPTAIGYEKVNFFQRGSKAAHAYGTYEGVLWVAARNLLGDEAVLAMFTVGGIKKLATGYGKAEKEEMEVAAMTRWAYIPDDDNEADALWCAECTRREQLGL
jgi:Holliday junction resolvasome RuvABC endonuclease subunit